MGTAWYDDHQHADAGHIMIRRAKDFLLVSAGDFKGDLGSVGYLGSSNENGSASGANTLYFNDRGDSQCADEAQYAGGQSNYGADAVIADEQSTLGTYIRSDLSSAYNTNDASGCYLSRLQDLRRLDSFYRSFVYVPQGNLFVVYDQAKAKASTSPRGPYLMHLRWHFPNTPNMQALRVTVTQGKSSLVMDTLLPSNAALSVVDERNNPDGNDCTQAPCTICEKGIDNAPSSCTPFGDEVNAGTMRVEVRTPGNPLSQEFLTAFQAGKRTMTPTDLHSRDVFRRLHEGRPDITSSKQKHHRPLQRPPGADAIPDILGFLSIERPRGHSAYSGRYAPWGRLHREQERIDGDRDAERIRAFHGLRRRRTSLQGLAAPRAPTVAAR
jgi:hypothetical protein